MSKITAYSAIASVQNDDVLPVVDVHDTTMAPSGTTKKISVSQIMPVPTAANQYPVSNSSDVWTLAQAGTVGGNSYSSGWTVATTDLGGEALYSSTSAGTATIPSGLTSTVGATLAFRQLGTGALTVAAAGGVTVEGTLTTAGQYQTLFARQVAANVWAVTGSSLAPFPGAPSLMPGLMPTGALAENFPRIMGTGVDTSLTTALPLLTYGPYVQAGVSYGHIDFYQSGTAPGTQTHAWAAILDTTGKVLAVSADAGSTAWNTGSFVTASVALAAPLVPTASQQTVIAVCVTAGTLPTFRGTSNNTLGSIAPIITGNSTTQSTPPAVGATVPLPASSASLMPYIYLTA